MEMERRKTFEVQADISIENFIYANKFFVFELRVMFFFDFILKILVEIVQSRLLKMVISFK